jgi:hypothetical protein
MVGDAKAEFDNSTITDGGLTSSETNLYVVMVEKRLVEGMDRFVDRLFCGK